MDNKFKTGEKVLVSPNSEDYAKMPPTLRDKIFNVSNYYYYQKILHIDIARWDYVMGRRFLWSVKASSLCRVE